MNSVTIGLRAYCEYHFAVVEKVVLLAAVLELKSEIREAYLHNRKASAHNHPMRKSDEKNKVHPRTKDRLFCLDKRWYFLTREGNRGPFDSRKEAETELKLYADAMEFINDNESSLPSGADWTNVTFVDAKEPSKFG